MAAREPTCVGRAGSSAEVLDTGATHAASAQSTHPGSRVRTRRGPILRAGEAAVRIRSMSSRRAGDLLGQVRRAGVRRKQACRVTGGKWQHRGQSWLGQIVRFVLRLYGLR